MIRVCSIESSRQSYSEIAEDAREFGLPAVAGIAQALATIHTGQRVRIDGNRGEVYLLES